MAKKNRPDTPKKERGPGKGEWHRMLEERRKINDKYYDILLAQLKRLGWDTIFADVLADLKQQRLPRIPDKHNLHVTSLPTVIALVTLLGILEEKHGEGTGRKTATSR